MFPAVIQIPKKSMKERKTEEKCGRVIFSALPTPVLRFHEDKKKLNQRHVLNFDFAELNSHKKKSSKVTPKQLIMLISHLLLFLLLYY
jgi:trans-2-enoyl-CoA reductase